jgi:urease accessory protein UreF
MDPIVFDKSKAKADQWDVLTEWLEQAVRRQRKGGALGDSLMEALTTAMGTGSFTQEQRTFLHDVLLAAVEGNVSALSRLMVVPDKDEQNLLADYRKLSRSCRAGIRNSAREMVAAYARQGGVNPSVAA